MSVIIDVANLKKVFRKEIKKEGVLASVKNLFRREYITVEALKGISFRIEKGEMVAIVGPNGAGKTTLLKTLTGILHPTEGYVEVLGYTPYNRRKEFLKKITFHNGGQVGFIAEATWDIPPLDAYSFLKDIYEIDDKTFKKNLDFFVDLMDMRKLIETPIRKLSTGERQKVEIIGALLHAPKVIFFDEPTIGLDILAQRKLRETLKTFVRENNLTLLVTSHYMRDIEDLGERIILLYKGEILYDGTREGIYEKFTRMKRLEVKLNEYVNHSTLGKYGKVVEMDNGKVTLLVRKEEARDVAENLLKNYPVMDISFLEPPLEDIIAEIYGGKT